MIRAALCDDEPVLLEELEVKLQAFLANWEVDCQISRFSSGRELLESGHAFDLIFMDIQMEPPDGMETARRLRCGGFTGILVFLTVLWEPVFESFSVEAFDYLVKPLEEKRFSSMMDRVLKILEKKNRSQILVQRGNSSYVILLEDILYVEVLGRKLYLHTRGSGVIDYYGRLNELESQVDRRFFRCHRSYLVNLDFVRGMDQGSALLTEGERIPVSRLRGQEFTQALLKHMKERRH